MACGGVCMGFMSYCMPWAIHLFLRLAYLVKNAMRVFAASTCLNSCLYFAHSASHLRMRYSFHV
jgi:hypothetical protein